MRSDVQPLLHAGYPPPPAAGARPPRPPTGSATAPRARRILVAGGAGYLGSHLVPLLLEHGFEVVVIDLLWFGNHLPGDVTVIQKDLFHCTEEDLRGIDQVIFLAGLSNDPMAEFDPSANFLSNSALPAYLAYLARRARVSRFIYGSTCSVYGHTADQICSEDSPATCAYPYGISKLQGERGVLQLQDDAFSVISLRMGTVCGFSPRVRLDLIVNTMFKSAMTRHRLTVNNPSIWRPILDIRDAAQAYLCAIHAPAPVSGVFNIASGNYTVGQVGGRVSAIVGQLTGEAIAIESHQVQDFRNYRVSVDRARDSLGFRPRHDVDHTIRHLHQHLAGCNDLDADQYYNIRVFQRLKAEQDRVLSPLPSHPSVP